jgi:hypothetical protein
MDKSTLPSPTFQTQTTTSYQQRGVNHCTFLDKLAQVRKDTPKIGDNKHIFSKLQKRAKAKCISLPMIKELAKLTNSPLREAYERSLSCCSTIEVRGGVATSRYCNGRWCMVCNRIRTGKLINAYKPILDTFKDPTFLTLSAPSISGVSLPNEIARQQKILRQIHDTLRKKGVKIYSIRKYECTWSVERAKQGKEAFHPHIHIVVDGYDVADMILSEWMNRNPKANRGGQDIKPCNEETIKELFKYFSKMVSKEGVYPTRVLDTIFKAMKGRRVFQATNLKIDVSEEVDDVQSEAIEHNASDGYYLWDKYDWVNFGTGEALANYQPDKKVRWLIETIRKE